jgi:hypothetical protein
VLGELSGLRLRPIAKDASRPVVAFKLSYEAVVAAQLEPRQRSKKEGKQQEDLKSTIESCRGENARLVIPDDFGRIEPPVSIAFA